MVRKKDKVLSAKQIQSVFNVLKLLLSVVIAMTLILVIIVVVSDMPFMALKCFFVGPFDSVRHICNVFENATPLIFAGAATCLLMATGDATLSGEGMVYFGAFITALVVINLNLPGWLLIVLSFVIGGIVCGILSLIPILMKRRFGTDSFVFSLLLNYILLYIGTYFLNYVLKDSAYVGIGSYLFPVDTLFKPFVANTNFTMAFVIALLFAVITWLFMFHTKWGYQAKMIRTNSFFAKYSGINVTKISLLVAALGGAVASFAGTTEMLGKNTRFLWNALPGFGWDGFMIATIAYYNPLLVPFAALFLGYIRTGANIMNLYTDVPNELISVIQAMMILLIASKAFLERRQQKMVVEQVRLREQLGKGEV